MDQKQRRSPEVPSHNPAQGKTRERDLTPFLPIFEEPEDDAVFAPSVKETWEMIPSLNSVREGYDIACHAYASKFVDELDHKPLDCELLQKFAATVGTRRSVLDVGCGPGHTTAHLTSLGLQATGVDLSPKMIELATRLFPQTPFEVGDFCSLRHDSSSVAGVLAFYCIVHLQPDQLVAAFSEMYRVLSNGGVLLLSFHVGSEIIRAENFLDTTAVLNFTFFQPKQVALVLQTAGFASVDVCVREPYETEHPSQRCYVFAHKSQILASQKD